MTTPTGGAGAAGMPPAAAGIAGMPPVGAGTGGGGSSVGGGGAGGSLAGGGGGGAAGASAGTGGSAAGTGGAPPIVPTCPATAFPSSLLNIGPPDGMLWVSGCGQTAIIDLMDKPLVADGDADFDLVYYENWTGTGIYMDPVIIHICTDMACNNKIEVFNWGDNKVDSNTNIGKAGYGAGVLMEAGNLEIPAADLWGTDRKSGVAIDVDAVAGVTKQKYRWLRISSVGNDMSDSTLAPEIDSIELLPTVGLPNGGGGGAGGGGAGGASGGTGGASGGTGGASGGTGGASGGTGGASGGTGGASGGTGGASGGTGGASGGTGGASGGTGGA